MKLVLFIVLIGVVGLKADYFIPSHGGSRSYGFNFGGGQPSFNMPTHPYASSFMFPSTIRSNSPSFASYQPMPHFSSSIIPNQPNKPQIRTLSGAKSRTNLLNLIAPAVTSIQQTTSSLPSPPPTNPGPSKRICFAIDDLPVSKNHQHNFYKPEYKATFEYVAHGGLYYPYGAGRFLYETTPATTTTTTTTTTSAPTTTTTTAASPTATATTEQAPTTTPAPQSSTNEICFELDDPLILKAPMKSSFYLPKFESTQVPSNSNGFYGYGAPAPPQPVQGNPYLVKLSASRSRRPGYYYLKHF